MKHNQALSSSDREFFALVTQAAFMNPFTDQRAEVDRRILGVSSNLSPGNRIAQVMEAVAGRVQALERGKIADLRGYSKEDQQVLKYAFLFDVFHRFIVSFDRLIQDDIEAGDALCPVPFAREALSLLHQRGFSPAVACGYFAMFYQLRRAYYFIDRSIVGRANAMKEFRRRLWSNVFTHDTEWYEQHLWNRMEDFSTLILGETGTGKGAAAAAIGKSSFIPFDDNKQRFVRSISRSCLALNLSQFPEALIESELFGHRKGAFTGAIDHHEGLFARSVPHGAVFLDEIGEVPETVQIKLLNVLQDRTFTPVGSHEIKRFHGRVIAATNRSPQALREEGHMRADFYYRLCSDVITAPTLRQRVQEDPDELNQLATFLIRRITGHEAPGLSGYILETLQASPGPAYTWPGNVRELEQAIRRILLTGRYDGDQAQLSGGHEDAWLQEIKEGRLSAQDVLSRYCKHLYTQSKTYGEVARQTGLDWRTVKKYVDLT